MSHSFVLQSVPFASNSDLARLLWCQMPGQNQGGQTVDTVWWKGEKPRIVDDGGRGAIRYGARPESVRSNRECILYGAKRRHWESLMMVVVARDNSRRSRRSSGIYIKQESPLVRRYCFRLMYSLTLSVWKQKSSKTLTEFCANLLRTLGQKS